MEEKKRKAVVRVRKTNLKFFDIVAHSPFVLEIRERHLAPLSTCFFLFWSGRTRTTCTARPALKTVIQQPEQVNEFFYQFYDLIDDTSSKLVLVHCICQRWIFSVDAF
jgi:hypothetical protein